MVISPFFQAFKLCSYSGSVLLESGGFPASLDESLVLKVIVLLFLSLDHFVSQTVKKFPQLAV